MKAVPSCLLLLMQVVSMARVAGLGTPFMVITAFPDPDRTARAFRSLDVLAVADILDHELVDLATHVLPATAQFERADLPSLVSRIGEEA